MRRHRLVVDSLSIAYYGAVFRNSPLCTMVHRIQQNAVRVCVVAFLVVAAALVLPSASQAQESEPWHLVDNNREQSVRKLVQRFSAFWELYGSTADRTAQRERGTWVVRQHDISREIVVDSLWFSEEGGVLNIAFDGVEQGYCAIRKRNLYVFLVPRSLEVPDPAAPTPPELESQIQQVDTVALEPDPSSSNPIDSSQQPAVKRTQDTVIVEAVPKLDIEVDVEKIVEEEVVEEEIAVELSVDVDSADQTPASTGPRVGQSVPVIPSAPIAPTEPASSSENMTQSEESVRLMIEEFESQLFELQSQLQHERSEKEQLRSRLESVMAELETTRHSLQHMRATRIPSNPIGLRPVDSGSGAGVQNQGPMLKLNDQPAVPLQPTTGLILVGKHTAIPFEQVTVLSQHKEAQYRLLYLPVQGEIHTFLQISDPAAFWQQGKTLVVETIQ